VLVNTQTRFDLDQTHLPTRWYNIVADLPEPLKPPLHPQTGKPIAGGLRYHGMSPLVSHLYALKLFEARAVAQTKIFEAGLLFARTEGIVPAPEPAHALAVAIEEAIRAREDGRKRVILFNLCGHGLLDLTSYEAFLAGKLKE
jgi:predicted alternative tryptophan synthase beta-subunit